ncbi:MAG: hypothetical protein OXC92_06845 [Flavobacteriaceae bacterium]|nr:hypothetical protein [Flavobacteriaceae bacterium]MCY4254069.1 hypothetical protein [Flavobacteriaceae bacterium]
MLDEAQHLGDVLKADFKTFTTTKKVLDHIHNGQLNNPLVLVVDGLGMTEKMFEKLGISRFDDGCAFDLERLDEASERPILQDWIYQGGNIDKDINIDLWLHQTYPLVGLYISPLMEDLHRIT